jgi:tetratricopeptide (TPR) repeat protein
MDETGNSWQTSFDDGVKAQHEGRMHDALASFEQSKKLAAEDQRLLARSLTKTSRVLMYLGQFEKARVQCKRALELARSAKVPSSELLDTLLCLGRLERISLGFQTSLDLLNEAQSICNSEPEQKPMLSVVLAERARSQYESDHLDEGRADIEEALANWEGPRDVLESVPFFLNLGNIYLTQKDFATATDMSERAIEYCRSQSAADHPLVVEALLCKAGCLVSLLKMDEVDSLANRAIAITRDKLGDDHFFIGTASGMLAGSALLRGEFQRASTLMDGAVARVEKVFGRAHPRSCEMLCMQALLLGRQAKLGECVDILNEVLPNLERVYGPSHSKVTDCEQLLSMHLQQMGKWEQAEAISEKRARLTEAKFGIEHPHALLACAELCVLKFRLKKKDEAEVYLDKCLAARLRMMCEDTVETAHISSQLALVCMLAERLEEAENLMQDAISITTRICGPNDFRTQVHLAGLRAIEAKKVLAARAAASGEESHGGAESDSSAPPEAQFASGMMDIFKSSVGQGLKGIAIVPLQAAIAESLRKGNWAEAETQARELITLLQEQSGERSVAIGKAYHMLGTVLLMQRKLGVTDVLKKALDIFDENGEKQAVPGTLGILIVDMGASGRVDEAERYFERLRKIIEETDALHSPQFISVAKAHAQFLRRASRPDAATKVEELVASAPKSDGSNPESQS